jgi:hypothetical protein
MCGVLLSSFGSLLRLAGTELVKNLSGIRAP